MKKIQVINELYNSIYTALKANSDLNKYVTNIYDYLPKQVTIPYLKLSIISYSNLHMLSNFATKARFACNIYTYHIDSMFSIMKRINLILEGFDNGTILENNCAVDQHNEILHSTINFDIFIKGGNNE
ncbi:DUF3168 domain-containing protein [Wolbachia endosymbiont of Tettigetta isshikii]|uniref:DUF3168 domain-containing protein n=1 Tax=Wolbachia endosymbiont of Tettigetta isshikii TaxID=3239093 RepID=UPI00398057C3